MDHFLNRLSLGTDEEHGVWVSLKKENPSLLVSWRDDNTNNSEEPKLFLIIFREKFFGPYQKEERYWPLKTESLQVCF